MAKTLVTVFLGPPGSGKGTQSKELALRLNGVEHVSTGELFRDEISRKTSVGIAVRDVINAGNLVSDDLTFEVLKSQLTKIIEERSPKVLILDGYPRTGAQVRDLSRLLEENPALEGPVFFELSIPKQEVVERISGRLVNPRTGIVYHVKSRPPKKAGICDEDGGELVQRSDDRPEVVSGRYDTYLKGLQEMETEVKNAQYKLFKIDATSEVEAITDKLAQKMIELVPQVKSAQNQQFKSVSKSGRG